MRFLWLHKSGPPAPVRTTAWPANAIVSSPTWRTTPLDLLVAEAREGHQRQRPEIRLRRSMPVDHIEQQRRGRIGREAVLEVTSRTASRSSHHHRASRRPNPPDPISIPVLLDAVSTMNGSPHPRDRPSQPAELSWAAATPNHPERMIRPPSAALVRGAVATLRAQTGRLVS